NSYTFNENSATFGMIKAVNSESAIYIDVGTFDGWLSLGLWSGNVLMASGDYDIAAGRLYGGPANVIKVSPGILKLSINPNLYGMLTFDVRYTSSDGVTHPLTHSKISDLTALNDTWVPFNQGTLPGVYKSVLHSAAAPDDAGSVAATEQLHTQDTAAPPSHTVVGEHDAFKAAAGGNETVDLKADPTSYFKEATAHIEGAKGGAVDTLHLTGDHQILDLTSLTGKTAAAKISGIEVIDLGGQHNTLKLSLVDVLNLGETDLFQQDGKQQLMVNGKEGDVVDLSNSHVAGLAEGEWQQHGTTQVGGVTYNVYEHSGAHTELLVQQGVQIAVH
ncbi:MAG: hypothetical protein JWR14_4014, partial [Caballeronia sp.]|nr:hypothetical protein [Caballeronia sp.]